VVHFEDLDRGELGRPPGPSVEARSHGHELWSRSLAHGVVDPDGAGHHHLGVRPQHLELDALTPHLRCDARADLFDGPTLTVARQRRGGRVVEPIDYPASTITHHVAPPPPTAARQLRLHRTLASRHGGTATAAVRG
jgi:hypothetical protein